VANIFLSRNGLQVLLQVNLSDKALYLTAKMRCFATLYTAFTSRWAWSL